MNPHNPTFAMQNRDFSTVMFFAFRYSLGRQSTAPSFMQDYIKSHISYFTVRDLEQMIDEIDAEARWHNLGDPTIDEPMWRQFQDDLRLEISRRGAIIEKRGGSDE